MAGFVKGRFFGRQSRPRIAIPPDVQDPSIQPDGRTLSVEVTLPRFELRDRFNLT